MHDIGIVVFDHLIPDEYMEFLGTIKSSDLTLAENEAEAPLEYGVLGKLDIDSEELEIMIENTKEGLDAAQSILD